METDRSPDALPSTELIDRILTSDESRVGAFSSQFLVRLFEGFPRAALAQLIRSSNDTAAAEGAWLLSELGSDARDQLPLLTEMVNHRYFKVRYWAVDMGLMNLRPEDGELIAAALSLLGDQEDVVREYAALQFAKLDPAVVNSGRRLSEIRPEFSATVDICHVMLSSGTGQLMEALRSNRRDIRSAAISCAIREKSYEAAVRDAAASSDDPVLLKLAAELIPSRTTE